MTEYKHLTKRELLSVISGLTGGMSRMKQAVATNKSLIKHYRRKLEKMRNQIDYMLEHPWSDDTGVNTKKHSRDRRRKQ